MLCGNEARAEDEVEERSTGAVTSTGATTNENEEGYKFDSTRVLLRLTTDDFCYDSYCFQLYSVGGGGGSPPRALLAPPDFPLRLARFSHALPIYSPFPVSPLLLPLAHPPCSTSQTPPLPYTPFGTSDSSTSSATRGLPSPV